MQAEYILFLWFLYLFGALEVFSYVSVNNISLNAPENVIDLYDYSKSVWSVFVGKRKNSLGYDRLYEPIALYNLVREANFQGAWLYWDMVLQSLGSPLLSTEWIRVEGIQHPAVP